MKLSDKTIEVLKNFASINPNIVFKPGSVVSTISEAKNILASATVEDSFDRQFGIYDLNEFLSAITLVDDPELELQDNYLTISGGSSVIKYFYSSPDLLTAPTKDVKMPKEDVVIALTDSTIARIKKAASVLGHSTLAIEGIDGKVSVSVLDEKNPTANRFSIQVDGKNACTEPFSFVMVIGNLKMLPGDYSVSISSKCIAKFERQNLSYFIALEKSSTFGQKPATK